MAQKKLKQKPAPFFLKIFLITTALGWVIYFSYLFLLPKDLFHQLRDRIFYNFNDITARLELIELYLNNNQFSEAENEINRLEKISPNQLNKEQQTKLDQLREFKHTKDPQEIRSEVNQWEKILSAYPDYRDGWLKIAVLYARLKQPDKTQEALKKAVELSPNYEITQELQKLLEAIE